MKSGATLVEVLISIVIFSIFSFGILAAFILTFRIIGLVERKITATQIAQGEIEKIRNIPYLEVGTIGAALPYSAGILEPFATKNLNGKTYNIERKIKFISDPTDQDEECLLDYKKAEISVSFSDIFSGKVTLTTDIFPKDKTEELQACIQQPAGILSVQVIDALGSFISLPNIEIFDTQGILIDTAMPASGKYDFPLLPGTYKVVVKKDGYSSDETFASGEVYEGKMIATPAKPNPIVLQNQITTIFLSIAEESSITVRTFSTYGQEIFVDSFENEEKISEIFQTSVFNGLVALATTTEGYYFSGHLDSIEISPNNLVKWEEFSFSDETPMGTSLKYHFYYASGTDWFLIPDSDLPGNSAGFSETPVNLKNLPITYSVLKIRASFFTNSGLLTPTLFDWQISWKTTLPVPIPNVSFSFKGEKIVGKDSEENLIYKISKNLQTNSEGELQIQNLEWDFYHFSDLKKNLQNLNLAKSEPGQPIYLAPATNLEVLLYLESQNSLLVTVLDSETSKPIFSSTVILEKSGFSQSQYTNQNGQTIFIPLQSQNYNLTVEAGGYASQSGAIFVSGETAKIIKLTPLE